MRSLPELGALLSECSADLLNATNEVQNAESLLDRAKTKQAAVLERFEALSKDFEAAKAAALAKGLRRGDQQALDSAMTPEPNVFDAGLDALDAAFDRATNPQPGSGNGVAF